jgi:hypothetical protein
MESNYYTPTLEEFCVGFEYEVLEKAPVFDPNVMYFMPPLKEDTWFRFKFPDPYVGWDAPKIFKREVRVKFLDKEDIESLGWSYFKKSYSKHLKEDCIVFNSEKYNCMLAYYPKTNRISVATLDPSKNETMLKTNWDDKQVNLISCKNKTELKKLLKQLEVC